MPATDVRTSPVREDLCRSAPFTLTRAVDEGSDGLTIEGYGAVFNSVTRISGWEGDFEEVIAPGAFKKSLRERVPRMQFDHGQHPLLGSLPLGRWTVAEEDERGLHLVGRLTENWLVTPFRDAIRDGGVEGMSFRFAVVRDEWVDAAGTRLKDDELADLMWRGSGDRGPIRRTLREVKASEAGPVVWPAYDDTAVGVRSRNGLVTIDLGRLREPGQRRELAGLVALADRAATGAEIPETFTSETPEAATERFRDLLGKNGFSVAEVDRIVALTPVMRTETVDAPPPDGTPTDPPQAPQGPPDAPQHDHNEPQPTAPPADPHPATDPVAAPEVTDRAAGEHSAPARPLNPVERRELIRKEFRAVTNRVLALPRHQPPKENSA